MTRNQIICTLGIIIAITQFLGIPYVWKNSIYLVVGCMLILLSALVYAREHHLFPRSRAADPLPEPSSPSLERFDQPNVVSDDSTAL